MPKRVAVFGGTFDPIHEGHVQLALQFARRLKLDEVLLVPTFVPPHKLKADMAAAEDRLAMCRLAAEEGGHARRLLGVYYLITGQVYCPAVPQPGEGCVSSWREVLRLRYHEESCGGLNYRRASEETTDECLAEIFRELSRDEYRHARQVLTLLEKQMSI